MSVTSLCEWRWCPDFVVVSALCADLVEPPAYIIILRRGKQARRYTKSGHHPAIAAGDDNGVEMDGGPVKDGVMDACDELALPLENVNLC
jgi:hypothetical protein